MESQAVIPGQSGLHDHRVVWMPVVDILNTVDRGTEKHIMETLEIEEPELADEIRKKMFVFEDILLLDDRAIQRVLRDVDNNDLAVLH